ncbi:riboflavin synthase subunit alpha [Sphingomonas sp. MMS24-J13]|uniref:riboflavin synthase subunit alpha n=1 Tax=Sphingomonas sp. MMS24-J13 TaxID=3238686 RepID=UPI00384DD909
MFTGIVQGTATIEEIADQGELRTLQLLFPEGFAEELAIGASVAVDGVCLTVTEILSPVRARFDVILQSLRVTTLGGIPTRGEVNIERAAKEGAEIGGHPLSGHIDFAARIASITATDANKLIRIAIPEAFRRYIFPKGYIAINGCSLTVSEVNRAEGWIEVWLIPETRRMTTLDAKKEGDLLNVEIERGTQVMVDTVREAVDESLGQLKPMLEALLANQNLAIEDLIRLPGLPAIGAAKRSE